MCVQGHPQTVTLGFVSLLKIFSSGATSNSYFFLWSFWASFSISETRSSETFLLMKTSLAFEVMILGVDCVFKTPKRITSVPVGAGFKLLGDVCRGRNQSGSWSPRGAFAFVCSRCHQLHEPTRHRRRQGEEAVQRPEEVHLLRDVCHVRAERGEGLSGW